MKRELDLLNQLCNSRISWDKKSIDKKKEIYSSKMFRIASFARLIVIILIVISVCDCDAKSELNPVRVRRQLPDWLEELVIGVPSTILAPLANYVRRLIIAIRGSNQEPNQDNQLRQFDGATIGLLIAIGLVPITINFLTIFGVGKALIKIVKYAQRVNKVKGRQLVNPVLETQLMNFLTMFSDSLNKFA